MRHLTDLNSDLALIVPNVQWFLCQRADKAMPEMCSDEAESVDRPGRLNGYLYLCGRPNSRSGQARLTYSERYFQHTKGIRNKPT
jgi:hypothetical protein